MNENSETFFKTIIDNEIQSLDIIESLFVTNLISSDYTFLKSSYFKLFILKQSQHQQLNIIIEYIKQLIIVYSQVFFIISNTCLKQNIELLLKSIQKNENELAFLKFISDNSSPKHKEILFERIMKVLLPKKMLRVQICEIHEKLFQWKDFRNYFMKSQSTQTNISEFHQSPMSIILGYSFSNKSYSIVQELLYSITKPLYENNMFEMLQLIKNIIFLDQKRNTDSYTLGLVSNKHIVRTTIIINLFMSFYEYHKRSFELIITPSNNFIKRDEVNNEKTSLHLLHVLLCDCIGPILYKLIYIKQRYNDYCDYIEYLNKIITEGSSTLLIELESEIIYTFKQKLIYLSIQKQLEELLPDTVSKALYDLAYFNLNSIWYFYENKQISDLYILQDISTLFEFILYYREHKRYNTNENHVINDIEIGVFKKIAKKIILDFDINFSYKTSIIKLLNHYGTVDDIEYIELYWVELQRIFANGEIPYLEKKEYRVHFEVCIKILSLSSKKISEKIIFSILDSSQYTLDCIKSMKYKLLSIENFNIYTSNIALQNGSTLAKLKKVKNYFNQLIIINLKLVKLQTDVVYENYLDKMISFIVTLLQTPYFSNQFLDASILICEYLILSTTSNDNKFEESILNSISFETSKSLFKNSIIIQETISKYYENNKWIVENIDKIDSKFIDPIMYSIIKTPVFLPNTDTIVDLKHITRHLKRNSYNPFTKVQLSIEELQEYNDRNDIKEKIKEFKTEFKTHILCLKQKNIMS